MQLEKNTAVEFCLDGSDSRYISRIYEHAPNAQQGRLSQREMRRMRQEKQVY